MSFLLRGILAVLLVSTLLPEIHQAHATAKKEVRCRKCRKLVQSCVCPPVHSAASPGVITTSETEMHPVYETRFRQEQTVTEREITETCYRKESYKETVPVHTTRKVTVDEGCYKMVWVPKIVTKELPETHYVERVAYRTVPYTVTRKIPEVTTKTVPYNVVKYVPATTVKQTYPGTPTCAQAASYAPPSCAAPFASCAAPLPTYVPPAPSSDAPLSPMPPEPEASRETYYVPASSPRISAVTLRGPEPSEPSLPTYTTGTRSTLRGSSAAGKFRPATTSAAAAFAARRAD